MTVWVLIVSISGRAIATQEFTSKERCEIAIVEAKAEMWNINAVCVMK